MGNALRNIATTTQVQPPPFEPSACKLSSVRQLVYIAGPSEQTCSRVAEQADYLAIIQQHVGLYEGLYEGLYKA